MIGNGHGTQFQPVRHECKPTARSARDNCEKNFFHPKDEEDTVPLPPIVLNMTPQTTSYFIASLKMPPTSQGERELARTLVFALADMAKWIECRPGNRAHAQVAGQVPPVEGV